MEGFVSISAHIVLLGLAALLFLIDALPLRSPAVSLQSLGLFFFALSFAVPA